MPPIRHPSAAPSPYANVQDTMVMGADFYESEAQREALVAAGGVPIGIGAGTVLNRVIIDKNGRIGENVKIINK
jgi:glucose-1-phosphate adenylyltransferase